MKFISEFAKKSNDLAYLSIADLSVIALAYETICKIGKKEFIKKEKTKKKIKLMKKKKMK